MADDKTKKTTVAKEAPVAKKEEKKMSLGAVTHEDVMAKRDKERASYEAKSRPGRRRRNLPANQSCPICPNGGADSIDYKDVYLLKKYTSIRGKIVGAEKSGVCQKCQRKLTYAIKQARVMALMPYVNVE